MIERGDCNYLKRVIEQSEYDELKYDKTVKKLIRACKMKLLRTNPPDATVEQANYSQAEPSQKLKCSVCKKYHHGPHDYNYGSANKPRGASANEASAPAAPKLEAAIVTITADVGIHA
jgi:hypothetical protein